MAVDPKDVFKTAEVFRVSSAILNNHGMPQCMFPMVICSAFSLELYLKALILVESGKPAKGHDLKDLFSKTTPESQKIIRASYETHKPKLDAMFAAVKGVPAPKTDFDFVLQASAKSFEHFRYAYEGLVKDQEGWMAGPICDGVRARIVELQPDWAN